MVRTTAMTAAMVLASAAMGQIRFNETLINPPGTDQGYEAIELFSDAPNFSMDGLTIVVIEGDANVAGVIDQALSLTGKSTGSNNLFIWRDGVQVIDPAPAAETSIFVQDFVPDLENGANSFLIVSGFTGSVGQDLDTNNDGILETTPWTSVIAAIGYQTDGTNRGFQYASAFGGVDASDNRVVGSPSEWFTPDTVTFICGRYYALDVIGSLPGPFINDPLETVSFPAGGELDANWLLSIGSPNIGTCTPACAWQADLCYADYNNDGGIDGDDVIAFFADWDQNLICADADGSEGVDGDDVSTFFGSWDTSGSGFPGC